MKITFNGLSITEYEADMYFRGKNGTFSKAWFRRIVRKIKRFLKQLTFWIIVLIVIPVSLFELGAYSNDLKHVQAQTVAQDTLQLKITELKNNVLDEVEKGESQNIKASDGVIQFDPDHSGKAINVPSIGKFQFKQLTVITYEKKLYGKTVTPAEAVIIALDEQQARSLASDIIFNDGGIDNWYNTANAFGLRQQISIIKELEK